MSDTPRRVDIVAGDPSTGEVVLVMVHDRPWTASGAELPGLQDRLNDYLAFALDGQMFRDFPETAGRAFRVELLASSPLPPCAHHFVASANAAMVAHGTRMTVRVRD